MSLSFYIDYNGQCEAAFNFYATHLGGKIGTMLRAKVVHANIRIEGVEIAGADVDPDQYSKPAGFYVLLGVDSADKVRSGLAGRRDTELGQRGERCRRRDRRQRRQEW